MKALILAAGPGKGLSPFTATRPKAMINVGGRFLLENIIRLLREAGVNDLAVVVGHQRSKITEYFGRGTELGVNISYVYQEEPRGIADAILKAREFFYGGEYFLLVYSDHLTVENIYLQALESFGSFRAPVASICHTPEAMLYGNVYLDSQMRISRIVEKPRREDLGNYVLAGVFVLPARFFSLLEEAPMERGLERLIAQEGLYASIWEGSWIDACYPWDILIANRMVMDTWDEAVLDSTVELRGDVKIEGPVHIEGDVVVESGTTIKGPCYLGKGSFIGNNVLIRKYTCIGPRSTIGYGVELKNCVMFGRSRVGRLSFVGDSVVGEGVDIGSGTMTVNNNLDGSSVKACVNGTLHDTKLTKLGAFIGDGAKIGASNTMMAGTVIEAGALILHNRSYPREG